MRGDFIINLLHNARADVFAQADELAGCEVQDGGVLFKYRHLTLAGIDDTTVVRSENAQLAKANFFFFLFPGVDRRGVEIDEGLVAASGADSGSFSILLSREGVNAQTFGGSQDVNVWATRRTLRLVTQKFVDGDGKTVQEVFKSA